MRPEYPWARFSLGMRQKGTGGYRAPGRAVVFAWAPGAAPAPSGAGSADPLAFSIIELVAFLKKYFIYFLKFILKGMVGRGETRRGRNK